MKFLLEIKKNGQIKGLSLKTQAPIEAEKSVTEIFVGEKKKWKNKGPDKQYVADSLWLCHTVQLVIPYIVLNFKILSQVVSGKSLTQKRTKKNRHTNIY